MTAFFYLFFIWDFFWCLKRSGFVVGARENGLGARPNFLYAGKTLIEPSDSHSIFPLTGTLLQRCGLSFPVSGLSLLCPTAYCPTAISGA